MRTVRSISRRDVVTRLRAAGYGAPEKGFLVGASSGTAVVAALRVAARGEVQDPVVALLPDGWDRYRSKPWMQGFV